ncbi:hypothetical protein [Superficieibacter sp. 1612_C1]|nr:hypothetical protein [Superficieibacter sp. 1612_C1]
MSQPPVGPVSEAPPGKAYNDVESVATTRRPGKRSATGQSV